ncbi:right-handed parallel beta-helix repeat-containing protein [Shinella yambaruensis]|uniref:Right-handed parallel beta-helix repeat-containing protein n=1 Tax=Shinella yambaruensis TaxID=415996 RepID=A0ABQ5ZIE5_9HYPH|nr:right-handed parallel beta-helix repeat-containing protein [Shinella yambaruensis]MCJ8026560.1 right-handed parallel beta-helix repeat-containing protein [Shinella yambaruensis]MCU7982354.1 right-handed parallel beta-helix repeat-containing protein [Shinella yambaruensis]GLR51825.1 hypothetical protein GCM10007923_30350 [Shinella yambaruensis]
MVDAIDVAVAPIPDLAAANVQAALEALKANEAGFATSAQGAKADTALQPTTGVFRIATFVTAPTDPIPSSVDRVFVEDRRAHFAETASEPPHALKFQNGGKWWTLDELAVTPFMAGAVGDGVADDTVAVKAIVAFAYLVKATIHWPNTDFFTTESIPNFWHVVHTGPGRILRGSDVWRITPTGSNVNIVYVSAVGSDLNDGLSASQPVQTLAKVRSILFGTTADQRDGNWEFRFAAGTYPDATNFTNLPPFKNPIRFIGAGSARDPQTVFDGAYALYQTAGMYFLGRTNVYLQYLKFINFSSGYGALAERNCQIELEDCTAVSCLTGFSAGYSSFIRTTRCEAYLCGTGFRAASNGQGSFTPRTWSFEDHNGAYECGIGFKITRVSYGHIDYNEIEDCAVGLNIEIHSRTSAEGNNFKRNTVAVSGWTAGHMSRNNAVPNIFNQSDPTDRNQEVYQWRGASGIVNDHGQIGTIDTSLYKNMTPTTVTGTGSATQIGGTLYTATAGWFVNNTKRVKFRAWGTVTTPSDATISLQLRLASNAVSALSLPGSISAQPWVLEVECIATAGNAQKTFSKVAYNGGAAITEIQTDAVDCLSANRAWTFFTDANGGGATSASITVESMELVVCG